jgi:pantothenate kinase-related protein Tda10
MLVASYKGMLKWYEKLAPLQDKIFKYMKREIEDINESERWRLDDEEEEGKKEGEKDEEEEKEEENKY